MKQEQALPSPDGRDTYGPGAWWLLSSGAHVIAQPGCVYSQTDSEPHGLDDIERDALATLAAVHWARDTARAELDRDHPQGRRSA